MADIDVEEVKNGCRVTVREGGSQTTHQVGVPEDIYQKLTQGKISKAECVRTAFRFLLDRESKESILSKFDLPVISRYFPEFEREFSKYLKA